MAAHRQRLQVNGLNFVVTDQGSPEATPIVLLHGFPNNANIWDKQIPVLTKAGYRVIAPDLRGALGGDTDAPQDPEAYSIPKVIVKDVAGILDALHIKKAHIVGHDWGSALAWAFAAIFPERTLQLVAISVGHPSNYFKGDHRGDQKKKSWYMLLLNVPDAGEQALATGFMFDGIATKEALEVEQPMFQELGFMEAIQDKKALTASINWYRANANPTCFLRGHMCEEEVPPVTCDVLQIWPTGDDGYCTLGQAKTSDHFVKSPGTFRFEQIETPSHFAIWTDPEPVSNSILSFLRKE